MKKLLLAFLAFMFFIACSKKGVDKMSQTKPSSPQTPVPVVPTKPVETEGRTTEILNLPEGIDSNLMVSLNRTPCFGSCPAYKFEIFKDGTVKYQGLGYVKRLGFHTAKVDAKFIDEIQNQALAINYLKFSSRYPTDNVEITDLPKTISYIRIGSVGKMIHNNLDAPKELVAFERWLEKSIEGLKWQEAKD